METAGEQQAGIAALSVEKVTQQALSPQEHVTARDCQ